MSVRSENKSDQNRLDRELQRERQQRILNGEARMRLDASVNLRSKDARESTSSHDLTRQPRF